jgi:hypothetical protein
MDTIRFQVTALAAAVEAGVPVVWQGQEFSSGRLEIALDPRVPAEASCGTLDYSRSSAEVEFHVTLAFPEFAGRLRGLGVSDDLLRPVRAVLRSSGPILEDHSFRLAGSCRLENHALLPQGQTAAEVLAGT